MTVETVVLELCLTKRSYQLLEALVPYGVYGATEEEIVRRAVDTFLEDFVPRPTLVTTSVQLPAPTETLDGKLARELEGRQITPGDL